MERNAASEPQLLLLRRCQCCTAGISKRVHLQGGVEIRPLCLSLTAGMQVKLIGWANRNMIIKSVSSWMELNVPRTLLTQTN